MKVMRKEWKSTTRPLPSRPSRFAAARSRRNFTQPASPIEGHYRRILLVRDLASGKQLLSLPLLRESTEAVIAALGPLFERHQAPLVLKADGGGPFTSDAIKDFLERFDVELLTSPPEMPRYNGSIEAGVGSLKTRAHEHAARHGRECCWSLDDVEAARLQANEIGRPWGATGPTPNEALEAREPLTDEERARFRLRVDRVREDIRRRSEMSDGGILPELAQTEHAKWKRTAITKALQDLGLLRFQRGRIAPPISSPKAAKIP